MKEVEEQLLVALKNKSLFDPSFFTKSTRAELQDVAHLVQRFLQTLGKICQEFSARSQMLSEQRTASPGVVGLLGGFTSTPWGKIDTHTASASLKKYIQTLTLPGAMPELYDGDGERLGCLLTKVARPARSCRVGPPRRPQAKKTCIALHCAQCAIARNEHPGSNKYLFYVKLRGTCTVVTWPLTQPS